MADLTVKPRKLLPAESRGFHIPHLPITRVESKTKRRSFACTSCKKKKVKCSGPPPCEACVASKSECSFEPSTDQRRKSSLKIAQKDAENYRKISLYMINILRSGTEEDVNDLVKQMQQAPSLDLARADLQLMASQKN